MNNIISINSMDNKPKYKFYSKQIITLITGMVLIALFILIFIIFAIINKRLDFYSFFYHNIKGNILEVILSGVHVAMLGFGIFLIFNAFFNMTPSIYCYDDRFVISMLLQKKFIIYFDNINKSEVKIYYNNYENLFEKYPRKECRVFFINPVFNFYLSYPVEGYFDDIEIFLKKQVNDVSNRCMADRESIKNILKIIRNNNDNISIPFLPNEHIKLK